MVVSLCLVDFLHVSDVRFLIPKICCCALSKMFLIGGRLCLVAGPIRLGVLYDAIVVACSALGRRWTLGIQHKKQIVVQQIHYLVKEGRTALI